VTEAYLAKDWQVVGCVEDISSVTKRDNLEGYKLKLESLTDAKIVSSPTRITERLLIIDRSPMSSRRWERSLI